MRTGAIISSLLLLCALSECYMFDLKPQQEKCLKQDFAPNIITTGKVEVNPVFEDMALQFRVKTSVSQHCLFYRSPILLVKLFTVTMRSVKLQILQLHPTLRKTTTCVSLTRAKVVCTNLHNCNQQFNQE
jgi:hypothetical protein